MDSERWHDIDGGLFEWCDRESEQTLRRVLERLPAEAFEFALARCAYAAIGPEMARAQVLPPLNDRYLVLLTEGEKEESVIAHEIAHAFLGHPDTVLAGFRDETVERTQEAEARALAVAWGFTGSGATIDGHASETFAD